MSGIYRTQAGDTWSIVARVTTGIDTDADTIRRANPGVGDPIPAGTILQIPIDRSEPLPASRADGLVISCNSQTLGTVSSFSLALSIDAIAKAAFSVPNERETRALLKPFTNPGIQIDRKGKRIFTGRAFTPRNSSSESGASLEVDCFSRPGVLELVPLPASAFPWEYFNANLQAVAGDMCSYHGIPAVFKTDTGPVFEHVDIKPTDIVLPYLAGLAAQRGPLITSSEKGELVFWAENPAGSPVDRLDEDWPIVESVEPSLVEERWYSSVTGYVPHKAKKRQPGAVYTVRNPHAGDLIRTYTFEARDIEPGELPHVVEIAAGRMMAGAIGFAVVVAKWEDRSGNLYRPNTTIELKAPTRFVEDYHEFLITDVVLSREADAQKAALTLTLPGVFSGVIPKGLPWR